MMEIEKQREPEMPIKYTYIKYNTQKTNNFDKLIFRKQKRVDRWRWKVRLTERS